MGCQGFPAGCSTLPGRSLLLADVVAVLGDEFVVRFRSLLGRVEHVVAPAFRHLAARGLGLGRLVLHLFGRLLAKKNNKKHRKQQQQQTSRCKDQ